MVGEASGIAGIVSGSLGWGGCFSRTEPENVYVSDEMSFTSYDWLECCDGYDTELGRRVGLVS
jgi:hypothetical protein